MAFGLSKNDVTIRIGAITKGFEDGVKRVKSSLGDIKKELVDQWKSASIATGAIGVTVGLAINEFKKFELGLAGVQKVADLSAAELRKFEKNIDSLSKKIPVSTDELFEAAEAAAVLGVRGADNLTKFAETMGRLGVATDVNGEEAAKSISRIIQLSGESIDTIDRFGSALVGLGNNFKASESEILANATVIRQATAAYKISSHEILALAAASREAGIASDLAGTSVGMTLRAMEKALAKGGQSLEAFEKVMGLTRKEIAALIKESPAKAFQTFVNGLSRMNVEGKTTILMMEDMGLGGRQLMKTLPSLAKINDRVNMSFDASKELYKENNALLKESDTFFETLQKKQDQFINKLRSLGRTLGETLAPALEDVLEILGSIVETLNTGLKGIQAFSRGIADALMILTGDFTHVAMAKQVELMEKEEIRQKAREARRKGKRGPSGTPDAGGAGADGTGGEEDASGGGSAPKDRREAFLEGLRNKQQMEYEQTEEFNQTMIELLEQRLKSESESIREKAKKDLKILDKYLNDKKKKEIDDAKAKAAREEAMERRRLINNSSLVLGETQKLMSAIAANSSAHNRKVFYAQQALNASRVIMDTAVGVTRQYADLPFWAAVAMKGLVLASGAAQMAVILGQEPPKMQTGGIVGRDRGTPSTGDHQLRLLEAGEFVVPRRDADQEIDKRARERGYQRNDYDMDEDQMEDKNNEIMISLQDDASDFIFAERRKNISLGIGVT